MLSRKRKAEVELNAQLTAQLQAVGNELAAERRRAGELQAQLRAVGEELAAERTQVRELQDRLAPLSAGPQYSDPWVMLGHLSLQLERPERAAEAFQEAVKRTPQGTGVLALLAGGLARLGRWQEAAQVAQRSLEAQPGPEVAVLLGDCLLNSASTGYVAAEPAYRAAVTASSADAQRGLGECLARKREFDAARDVHDLWFQHWIESDQTAELRQRQAAAQARGLPPIAFVAMQKSASEYIRANLLEAFDLPEIPVSIGTIPVDRAVPSALRQLARGGALCRSHMSGDNARALADAGLDRLLLHVRDPRQVTVSWVLMMRRITEQEFVYSSAMYDPPVPDVYRSWAFEHQLAWGIENYLPGQLDWLQSWVDTLDGNLPLRICVTTFEQFRKDQAAFYRRVLEFFAAPVTDSEALNRRTAEAMRNFRRGSTSEWKDLFTAGQRRALEPRLAPLAKRFGWEL
jgi:tetratricopeptide (TPR) repeat protein